MYEGVVYRYINTAEGDEYGWSYVGTTMNEKVRRSNWNKINNKNYGGAKINEARQRFGLGNFRYEVLARLYSDNEEDLQRQLKEKETEFITLYSSINNGYNTSAGGTGNKGVNFSATHRANIGAASKGRIHSDVTKQKISDKMKGRKVKDSTKAKISAGNKGKKRSPAQNAAQSKRMKGKTPVAATAGAKAWVANNGGGYWKNHTISDAAKANMKAAQHRRARKIKAIYSDGSEKIYDTMLDAAKACGLNVGSVSYLTKYGGISRKNKLKFQYYV